MLIEQVPEYERISGARLHTGGTEFAVAYQPFLASRLNPCRVNALNAERALLHHPFFPHGHIRVELPFQRLIMLPGEPVEPADLVGTVLAAEAGAYAPVVDLVVDPFSVVLRAEDRAYRFARRLIAMLTEHGEKADERLLSLDITLNIEPRHVPAALHLPPAYDAHVIFGVTAYDTGAAADAAIEIDDHCPTIIDVLVRRIIIDLVYPSLVEEAG